MNSLAQIIPKMKMGLGRVMESTTEDDRDALAQLLGRSYVIFIYKLYSENT